MLLRIFSTSHIRMLNTIVFGIFIISLLFLNHPIALAQKSITVHGKTFIEKENKWFLKDGKHFFEVIPNVVSVKFRDDIKVGDKANFYYEQNTNVIRENRLGVVDLKVPSGISPIEFVIRLQETGMFDFAEVNTVGEYIIIPNDPQFNDQWGLNNEGQTGGTVDADIDAPDAWDFTTGDPDVVVAVLDSGVDIDHEDLGCNIFVNPGEDLDGDGIVWDPNDFNGIDDDGNGFVDDIVGWDFGNGNSDPRGIFFHGTHVAGIVGACGNNAKGVIGVAGGYESNPGSKIMTLGVGDISPNGSVLDDAILYATDMGAKVITLSLSVAPSNAIDLAINDAYEKGVFIDNAAGNTFCGPVSYPATHPSVMAVGATDHNDMRAQFSACGPELEVVAPGVNILSTQIGDTYGTSDGTSFASPHVAGLAALLFSLNPNVTNVEVRQCIAQTAEDQVGNPVEDIPGEDNFYGFGRINAQQALECIPAACNLGLNLNYIDGTLNLNFDVGTEEPVNWNAWLNSQSDVFPLLSAQLPAIDPPISFPLSLPFFPQIGTIGVLTTLTTKEKGIICSDFQTVNTGVSDEALSSQVYTDKPNKMLQKEELEIMKEELEKQIQKQLLKNTSWRNSSESLN